jgi:hypothetical protein
LDLKSAVAISKACTGIRSFLVGVGETPNFVLKSESVQRCCKFQFMGGDGLLGEKIVVIVRLYSDWSATEQAADEEVDEETRLS